MFFWKSLLCVTNLSLWEIVIWYFGCYHFSQQTHNSLEILLFWPSVHNPPRSAWAGKIEHWFLAYPGACKPVWQAARGKSARTPFSIWSLWLRRYSVSSVTAEYCRSKCSQCQVFKVVWMKHLMPKFFNKRENSAHSYTYKTHGQNKCNLFYGI